MSRHNDPIEREGPDDPDLDEPTDPIPVPDGEPVPSPIEEPGDQERVPVDEPDDRHINLVS